MTICFPALDQGLYPVPAMAETNHEEASFLRREQHENDFSDGNSVSRPRSYERTPEVLDASPAECGRLPPKDSGGAVRGLVFVLGFYMVMGVLGLSGFMLWDWLRSIF
jgi:hypothetical protein